MLTNNNNSDFMLVRQVNDIESLRSSSEHQSRNNNDTNPNIVPSEAPLPTYEEAVDTTSPPPTYAALFGKVREARNTSSGTLEFIMKVFFILVEASCAVLVVMKVVIPICMIVFGSIYIHQCPVNEYIPVFLIVGGILGIMNQLLNLSTRIWQKEKDIPEDRLGLTLTHTLIFCFLFGWFIIGSYWIYKEYKPNYDPIDGLYCNKSLYLFAFWLITSVYIFVALIFVGIFYYSRADRYLNAP